MNKGFKQFNDEREDWTKKTKFDKESLTDKEIKKRLFKKLKEANIELKGKRIVQLGCTGGYLMKSLLAKGAYVHAVDFSSKMLEITSRELSSIYEKYALSSIIRDFSILSDFTFDIVIAVTMLEHLPENMAERIMEDAKRLLKEKTGIFIFRLPFSKVHHTVYHTANRALDTVFWTGKDLTKIAHKYRYHAVNIDHISIFYKGSNQ